MFYTTVPCVLSLVCPLTHRYTLKKPFTICVPVHHTSRDSFIRPSQTNIKTPPTTHQKKPTTPPSLRPTNNAQNNQRRNDPRTATPYRHLPRAFHLFHLHLFPPHHAIDVANTTTTRVLLDLPQPTATLLLPSSSGVFTSPATKPCHIATLLCVTTAARAVAPFVVLKLQRDRRAFCSPCGRHDFLNHPFKGTHKMNALPQPHKRGKQH